MTSGRIWRRRAFDTAPLGDKNSVLSDHVRGVVARHERRHHQHEKRTENEHESQVPAAGRVAVCPGRTRRGSSELASPGEFREARRQYGWAEGFNIPNNQEFRVVSENGKRWLRIENRDPGRQLDYVHAYVKVTPRSRR